MTAPHVGNTGWNDEDDESSRIWVAGYVVRDPAAASLELALHRSLEDELDAQGVVGICDIDTRALTRHLRERGAMRVGIFSGDVAAHARRRAARTGSPPPRRWPGPRWRPRSPPTDAYVVPAVGERRFTVAAVDLGIKSMTPRRMAERGIEVHVLPATATPRGGPRRRARRGVLLATAPATRRPPRSRPSCSGACCAPGSRTSASASATRSSARRSGFGTYKLKYGHRGINQPVMDRTTGKVEVTAHNHGFAVDAPLDGRDRDRVRHRPRSRHVCLNDDVVEGLEVRDGDRLVAFSRPVPPGGGGRPARRRLPLRPLRRSHDHREGGARLMPKRDDITQRPRHRLRPDRHRPGLRVRLLRHPGLPRAARGGHPGHPRQLQPGDDHDRPGVRRRHLRRADHPGDRREDHRQGAPGRRPRDPRRPDRAQLRDRPARARRPREVRLPAHRRQRRGHPARRGPREVQGRRRALRRRVGPLGRSATRWTRCSPPPTTSATRSSSGPPSRWAASAPASRTPPRSCAASRGAGLQYSPGHRGAPRGVDPRLEGVRARGDARPRRQRRRRLLHREPRPDGRPHRRLDHRRAGADPHRPRVPAAARHRHRRHPRGRRRHRRLQHPVRGQPAATAGSSSSR